MFRPPFLVLLIIAAPTVPLLAQEPTVRSGERVRVELRLQSERPLVGTVKNMDHHALLLRIDESDVTVNMDSVVRLDVSHGKGNRTANILKNGAAGLLVGAAGGALIGPLLWSKDCYSSTLNPQNFGGCFQSLADGHARLEAATYFGIAGALIGGFFGAVLGTDERWDEVRLDRMQLAVTPKLGGGFAAGMRVAF